MHDFLIRRSQLEDLDAIHPLAQMHNSINLPNERDALARVLENSQASFDGEILDPFRRDYVFVMVETTSQKIVGTCQIIAQHGAPDAPHVFLELHSQEHHSETLGKSFNQQLIKLGFDYDGPTEVGGLILDPAYRAHPGKLGKQLSLMRFLFIAANRKSFKNRVFASMMPPMPSPGNSTLWEAFGRRFTGLDYVEAETILRTNKEFVKTLMPTLPIYTCLFDAAAQGAIGVVGKGSEPAARILKSIGFEYHRRLDPFDGGPNLEAQTDSISVVKNTRPLPLSKKQGLTSDSQKAKEGLLLSCKAPFTPQTDVRCIKAVFEIDDDGAVVMMPQTRSALGLHDNDYVYALDFGASSA